MIFKHKHALERISSGIASMGFLAWLSSTIEPDPLKFEWEPLLAFGGTFLVWIYTELNLRNYSGMNEVADFAKPGDDLSERDLRLSKSFLDFYNGRFGELMRSWDGHSLHHLDDINAANEFGYYFRSIGNYFLDSELKKDFENVLAAYEDWDNKISHAGGRVVINIGERYSIRNQDELGGRPLRQRTKSDIKDSNELADKLARRLSDFEFLLSQRCPRAFE